jgi:hypothetical protein
MTGFVTDRKQWVNARSIDKNINCPEFFRPLLKHRDRAPPIDLDSFSLPLIDTVQNIPGAGHRIAVNHVHL